MLSLAIQIPFALGIALMLNRRFPGRAVFRLLFFAPYVIAEVIAGVVWRLILQPDGLADGALTTVGLGVALPPLAGRPDTVLWALFVIISWKYFGFHMIIMLAGLQGIPRELEEAAAIDGASRRQAIRYVTLPLLGPTIRVSVFLSIIGALQLFDLVWVTTGGGPVDASNTMATYLVDRGFERFQLGYGSAIAVILFLVCLVVALAYQRFVLRRDIDGALTAGAARWRPKRSPNVATRSATVRLTRGRRRRLPAGRILLVPRRRDRRSRSSTRPSAGSRTTTSCRRIPIGAARSVGRLELHRRARVRQLLAAARQQRPHRARITTRPSSAVRRPRGVRVRATDAFPGREVLFTLFTLGLLFPSAVAILPLFILVRTLGLLDNPLGIALPQAAFALAADDHHPAAVLPEHPDRARGRRADRRLRVVRVLLADPAAAVPAGAGDRRRARDRGELERRSCCRS